MTRDNDGWSRSRARPLARHRFTQQGVFAWEGRQWLCSYPWSDASARADSGRGRSAQHRRRAGRSRTRGHGEPLLNGKELPKDSPVFGKDWYSTDLFTDWGLKFVDAALAEKKPFFLNVLLGMDWATLANTPFRRYKHFTHEGGISTPLIAHWPAAIPAERTGPWRNSQYT